jgi:very-short-patch-repair endonuclease
MLRNDRIVSLLPGIYVSAASEPTDLQRAVAVMLWRPDAVLTHEVAARPWWPEVTIGTVRAAVRARTQADGYSFSERTIPPEQVCHSPLLRYTSPALTALDLCLDLGPDAVDRVLASRAATLGVLRAALRACSNRSGNKERQTILLDSRDEPWSAAEREAHRLLRRAGLRGWTTNRAIRVDGSLYYLDIAFGPERVAVEIDGRQFHSDSLIFESDRIRQNKVVLAGWTVLRFTWQMLTVCPDQVVADIRRALFRARRRGPGRFRSP